MSLYPLQWPKKTQRIMEVGEVFTKEFNPDPPTGDELQPITGGSSSSPAVDGRRGGKASIRPLTPPLGPNGMAAYPEIVAFHCH